MQQKRKRRLMAIVVGVSGVALAAALVLYTLRKNIDLYYTPQQALRAHLPNNTIFRLGGMVEKGSVQHDAENLGVSFVLTDYVRKITVSYQGVLPSLFREGQGIIARGRLQGKIFVAQEVLAKHDESYKPPSIGKAA